MSGFLKDLVALLAVAAALVAVAWFTGSVAPPPLTGRNCAEIVNRLAAQKDHVLTPAEATDVANCSAP
jgi:hypothetical protein